MKTSHPDTSIPNEGEAPDNGYDNDIFSNTDKDDVRFMKFEFVDNTQYEENEDFFVERNIFLVYNNSAKI